MTVLPARMNRDLLKAERLNQPVYGFGNIGIIEIRDDLRHALGRNLRHEILLRSTLTTQHSPDDVGRTIAEFWANPLAEVIAIAMGCFRALLQRTG
jgi:hypothetical protein